MKTLNSFTVFMISVFALTAALAQLPTAPLIPGAPTESCSYLQAPADTATRLLAGKGDIPYQFSCKENRCRVGALTPGDIVPLLAEKNGWSCVASDLTSGWVPADRVTPMPDEPGGECGGMGRLVADRHAEQRTQRKPAPDYARHRDWNAQDQRPRLLVWGQRQCSPWRHSNRARHDCGSLPARGRGRHSFRMCARP